MIRVSPWGSLASELAETSRPESGASLLRRLLAPARGRWFWSVLWAAAAAASFTALVPVVFDRGAPVAGSEVLFRLVGASFAACGLVAWRRRPDSDVGRFMTVAGFGIFVYPIASQIDSPFVLTLGTLFSSVWTVALVALTLTFVTGGRLASNVDRFLVAAAFFALFGLQFASMLFAPYPDNLLLIAGDLGTFEAIGDAQRLVAVAVSFGVVAVIAARWRAASGPRRRALLPSVAGCLCALLFAALLLSWVLTRTLPEALSWVTNGALLTVPAAFLAGLLRSRLARGGLAELFRELGGLRGAALRDGLARSLGDPSLVLAHRDAGGYVDSRGAALALPPEGGDRSAALVQRDGRELGALVYDAALDDDPELVQTVSAAAAIALDEERSRVEAEARLSELRASRERLVTAGDEERRRLERNLHDGAQQRLVALGLQLRLLEERMRADPAQAEQLAAAREEVSQSLDELRELARGIHPAVLDHGLGTALESLALRSPVATAVTWQGPETLPEPVELAAYFVASEALTNVARYAHATSASVRVAHRDGTLRISSPPGAGTVVTAVLPCGVEAAEGAS